MNNQYQKTLTHRLDSIAEYKEEFDRVFEGYVDSAQHKNEQFKDLKKKFNQGTPLGELTREIENNILPVAELSKAEKQARRFNAMKREKAGLPPETPQKPSFNLEDSPNYNITLQSEAPDLEMLVLKNDARLIAL